MKDFRSKVAVITGAASGIGRALAGKCLNEGMKVVLADVEGEPLFTTEKEFKTQGDDVLAIKTDVRIYEEVEALLQKTLSKYGKVHLLFNNAGVAPGGAVWEVTLNDWEWVLGVNLWGVIHGIKAFIPVMIEQQTECHVVNTASIAGLIAAGIYDAPYRTTKHAIVSLTEALYSDLKMRKTKIGVSVLCPGEVESNLWNHERNRPPELRNSDLPQGETKEESRVNEMTPGQCADIVFDGIREKRLYILTHPGFNGYIKRRVDDILAGRNPLVPGEQGF
jgi:NAD(P)-dependent dehydrogenase (short-subunit alcohol dehydrogenase family)